MTETGAIAGPLIVWHPTFDVVARNPLTGVEFEGFQVPFFEEAKQLALDAAACLPGIRIIGWDIAITPDGPEIVEVNDDPGPDLLQGYCCIPPEWHNQGIRQRLLDAVGDQAFLDGLGFPARG